MLSLVLRYPIILHTQTVRRWTQEAAKALQDCSDLTDWDVLYEPHGDDIDNKTDCIKEYIRFCEDNNMPAWTMHHFPNKSWITSELKALLNKKRAFRSGDREELRRVQHELMNWTITGGSLRPNSSRTSERYVNGNKAHYSDERGRQADIREWWKWWKRWRITNTCEW